jgi:probable rRNA maturation factor
MISIEIADRQRLMRLDQRLIRRAVRSVLRAEGVVHASIEVAVVDDRAIARLHHQFLGDRSPTDVLTFPLHESGGPLSGVVVVSAQTAKRTAAAHETRPRDELILYVIHGVLHLAGYDDRQPRHAARMRRRQTKLLHQLLAKR